MEGHEDLAGSDDAGDAEFEVVYSSTTAANGDAIMGFEVEAAGVEYVSASDWIQDPAEFADNLHLSPAGAADFSRRLAHYLAQRPVLPEKAK